MDLTCVVLTYLKIHGDRKKAGIYDHVIDALSSVLAAQLQQFELEELDVRFKQDKSTMNPS